MLEFSELRGDNIRPVLWKDGSRGKCGSLTHFLPNGWNHLTLWRLLAGEAQLSSWKLEQREESWAISSQVHKPSALPSSSVSMHMIYRNRRFYVLLITLLVPRKVSYWHILWGHILRDAHIEAAGSFRSQALILYRKQIISFPSLSCLLFPVLTPPAFLGYVTLH